MKTYDGASLGKFVTVHPRADGTSRVLFRVPTKLRPDGWAPTIPLPIHSARRGNLSDPVEIAAIRADAETLYDYYLAARGDGASTEPPNRRNIAALIRAWENSQQYKDNRPATTKGYRHYATIIQRWAKLIGDPDPTKITVPDIEQFIGTFDDYPQDRYHTRKVLNMIMNQAVRLNWRPDNPVKWVKVKQPKTTVAIWTKDDVKRHVDHFEQLGLKNLAAIVLLEWEIGQRLTDVILFRHGVEYREGVFRFNQSKTDAAVAIPVSDTLREVIKSCRIEGSLYLFHDDATGRPYRDVQRLGHVFALNRPSGEKRVLRVLRHSCVLDMDRSGCTITQIRSITGHSLQSVNTILQTYLPRDSEVAASAQRLRGIL